MKMSDNPTKYEVLIEQYFNAFNPGHGEVQRTRT